MTRSGLERQGFFKGAFFNDAMPGID
jgi:hypothetical protein